MNKRNNTVAWACGVVVAFFVMLVFIELLGTISKTSHMPKHPVAQSTKNIHEA